MENKIKDKACIEVELCGRKHTVDCNESTVEIIKIDIDREHPCKYVLENEAFCYVYKVKNLSDTDVRDVKFKDTIHGNAEFVPNSFKVNGRHEKAFINHNTLEFCIKELKKCETLIISFEVKSGKLKNRCERCDERCDEILA